MMEYEDSMRLAQYIIHTGYAAKGTEESDLSEELRDAWYKIEEQEPFYFEENQLWRITMSRQDSSKNNRCGAVHERTGAMCSEPKGHEGMHWAQVKVGEMVTYE